MTPRGGPDAGPAVEFGADEPRPGDEPGQDDALDLGPAPRPERLGPRGRRVLSGAAVVGLAGAVVALVLTRPGDRPPPPPVAGPPPVTHPLLTDVGGRSVLRVPATSVRPVRDLPLGPAPAAVTAVAERALGLTDVRGGTVLSEDHYGLYLSARWGAGGRSTLTVYTARAPGTTTGTDAFWRPVTPGRAMPITVQVTAFTGTGWWVDVVVTGDVNARAEQSLLTDLALDPRLTPDAAS